MVVAMVVVVVVVVVVVMRWWWNGRGGSSGRGRRRVAMGESTSKALVRPMAVAAHMAEAMLLAEAV